METLWESPMVGASGTTVGDALVAMLEPGEQFIRQVEALGQGLAGGGGVFSVPILGSWLGQKCCQAYHEGFVEPLADSLLWSTALFGTAQPQTWTPRP
ncbi:MAG: hypothetical protein LC733_08995 [Actinobacteria bacterium]|nr:hypothetical protein [Actinomycetota bacterium]